MLVVLVPLGMLTVVGRADATPLPAAAGQYVPLTPARIVSAQSVAANATFTVGVLGKGGVPTTGVAAVQFSLSVRGTAGGSLTAWPAGVAKPGTSNVNFSTNVGVTGAVLSKLGTGGQVSIANNSAGAATIYVDVVGYTLAAWATTGGSGFVAMTPVRLLNRAAVAAGGSVAVAPLAQADIPAAGVTAVVAHLTVRSSTAGLAVAYPDGVARPNTTDLSYDTAFYATTLVTAKLGANGQFRVFTSTAATVYVDVVGYYHRETGATFVGTTPARVVNAVTVPAGHTYSAALLGLGGVPATGVAAVAFTLTALGTANGTMVVHPEEESRPAVADGHVRTAGYWPTLQLARLGANGRISIYNSSAAAVRIYVDVAGYFPTGAVPGAPATVQATPINAGAVVTWRTPVGSGSAPAASYRVTTSPGGATRTVTGTSAVVRGLTNGSAYTFTVQALGTTGAGGPVAGSAPAVPAVPPAGPPFPQHAFAVNMGMYYGSIAGGVSYDGVFAGSPMSRLAYGPSRVIQATTFFYTVPEYFNVDGEAAGPGGIMRYQWNWSGCGRITVGPEQVVQVPVAKGTNLTNFVHVPTVVVRDTFTVPTGCPDIELNITYSGSPEQFDLDLYSVGSTSGGPGMNPITDEFLPGTVLDTGGDVVLYRLGSEGEMLDIQRSGRLTDIGNAAFRYYFTSCESLQVVRGYLLEAGSPGMSKAGISKFVIPKEAAKFGVQEAAGAYAEKAGQPRVKVIGIKPGTAAGLPFETPEAWDMVAGAGSCTKLG